ncbi:MAG: hypothetical protein GKR90_11145 [Pseudomonadales bacterium]|nr:hypothetical protein [Pseudomonadales bacterium]
MNKMIRVLITAVGAIGLSACAQTSLEQSYGDSVKQMIANQTANENPDVAAEESGDGARLEGVIEDYRSTVSSRAKVESNTSLGVR